MTTTTTLWTITAPATAVAATAGHTFETIGGPGNPLHLAQNGQLGDERITLTKGRRTAYIIGKGARRIVEFAR